MDEEVDEEVDKLLNTLRLVMEVVVVPPYPGHYTLTQNVGMFVQRRQMVLGDG